MSEIQIQIDDEIITLTGKAKEDFLADQAQRAKIAVENSPETIAAKKRAVYEKLGLSEEEINLLVGTIS